MDNSIVSIYECHLHIFKSIIPWWFNISCFHANWQVLIGWNNFFIAQWKKIFIFTCVAMNGTILNLAISPKIKICELINAEYFMKTLKITSMFVSRMTVATKLLKMCLSNLLIDDGIFKRWKRIPVAILFLNISLATVTSSKLNVENSAKC